MNKTIKISAFTLIETIFYVLIFAIISVTLINTSLLLSEQSQDNVLQEQLSLEASLTFNKVINDLQLGDTIDTGLSLFGQNISSITYDDINGDTIKYSVTDGILSKNINSGNAEATHSTALQLSRFQLTRINSSSRVPIIQVQMTFRDNLEHTFSLETSINFSYE